MGIGKDFVRFLSFSQRDCVPRLVVRPYFPTDTSPGEVLWGSEVTVVVYDRVLWQTKVFITSSLSRVYNTVSNWFQTSMTCCRCLLVFETQFEISCPGPAVDIIYLPDIIIIHLDRKSVV